MRVLASLQDSDSVSDSYGAQESCQEKVSGALLHMLHEGAKTLFGTVLMFLPLQKFYWRVAGPLQEFALVSLCHAEALIVPGYLCALKHF